MPAVKQASGFVAGYWVQSEDAANGAVEMIRSQPASGAVSIVDMQVGEVVANA